MKSSVLQLIIFTLIVLSISDLTGGQINKTKIGSWNFVCKIKTQFMVKLSQGMDNLL